MNSQLVDALSTNEKLYQQNLRLRDNLDEVSSKFQKIWESLQDSTTRERSILERVSSISQKIEQQPMKCPVSPEMLFQPPASAYSFDYSAFNRSVANRIELVVRKFESTTQTFNRRYDQISFKGRKLISYNTLIMNGLNDIEQSKCDKMPLVVSSPERYGSSLPLNFQKSNVEFIFMKHLDVIYFSNETKFNIFPTFY